MLCVAHMLQRWECCSLWGTCWAYWLHKCRLRQSSALGKVKCSICFLPFEQMFTLSYWHCQVLLVFNLSRYHLKFLVCSHQAVNSAFNFDWCVEHVGSSQFVIYIDHRWRFYIHYIVPWQRMMHCRYFSREWNCEASFCPSFCTVAIYLDSFNSHCASLIM